MLLIFIFVVVDAIFNSRQLRLLQLNDFPSMALFHLLLCVAKGLVLSLELLVLLLKENNFLVQLLDCTCILSLDILGQLLVLSLIQTL
jgi:hypothetical protein